MADLIGKYEVVGTLGQGAMGTVYLARDPLIDRLVAIKLLRTDGGGDLERFRQEARVVGALSHPHIVVLHDVGFHEDRLYLAMQYVPGQSLEAWLREPHTLAEQLRIMEGLSSALAYAHGRGVLHRDLKPSNVQVTPEGEGCLMDFGIARAPETKLTATGTVMGTPAYLAPEVFADADYSPRADHYSLALVFYEMLAGVNPFLGQTLPATLANVLTLEPPPLGGTRPALPPALADAVMAHLARDPARRPPDLSRVQSVIRQLRSGEPGDSPTTSDTGDPAATHSIGDLGALRARVAPPAPPRRRAWLVAVAAASLALGYWAVSRQGPEPGKGASLPTTLAPVPAATGTPPATTPAPGDDAAPEGAPRGAATATPAPRPAPPPARRVAAPRADPTPTPEAPRPPPERAPPQQARLEPTAPVAEPPSSPTPTPAPVATPTPAATPAPAPPPAGESAAPTPLALSPRSGRRGNVSILEVRGTGFRAGQEVRLLRAGLRVPGLRVTRLSVEGPDRIRVTLFIAPDVPLGSYSLVLVDDAGRQSPPIGFEVVL